ncbi:hypothetical protein BHYA_0754g00020 [Botrytis hyacinthi]|uniref:Uncharacterized protein n=1 Tax=Botrytis hyacinthi TaxID=278943 RepID=A0A4Z1G3D7_9HELO|nr:hypothetical protein BHYA_0754g00020 [Botrytis hyacinthi]
MSNEDKIGITNAYGCLDPTTQTQYMILRDSDLGRQVATFTDRTERNTFIIKNGKKAGQRSSISAPQIKNPNMRWNGKEWESIVVEKDEKKQA